MKFNANLSESLKKSGQNPILQGYHIYVTKNVKPIPEEIKAIVTSCGGVILPIARSAWPADSKAISCVEDKTTKTKYTKKIPIVSPEWLLEGVLRQQLNLEDHRLN
ncbi:mediator of DNA damage checkpoint protein 1-like [Frankliniella occidentalis]|uniref:Mediator of DNA damage checkpoint protein 1-like n=1 Tax=Frankliniella occidentalis TaxID=133901 RepID=A0A9C6WKS5_FRAOC|nr:mediator of DNA damage checkpoint protein 1-like [Frankliniella occidentalis]